MRFGKLLPALFLILFQVNTFGQQNSDIQLWAGANVKVKLNKKWSMNLSPEFRFSDTIKTLNAAIAEAGVKYDLNKSIAFFSEYRYTLRPLQNDINRISLGATYSWSKKGFPLALSYRIKFQYSRNRNSGNSESYLRNKITLDYNLSKRLDPYLSYELFFLFGKNEFRNTRYSLGFEWSFTKNLSLAVYYMYQREIYVKKPSVDHIFGLTLNYKLTAKKRKDQPSVPE
ncbi:MAG: DUF2490 domain-containing protein [Bacteroidetes bacterium]|nr:DUF2490 domain-containing protein [Bacteroidota bacterium]